MAKLKTTSESFGSIVMVLNLQVDEVNTAMAKT
jgi:hypothetical protein